MVAQVHTKNMALAVFAAVVERQSPTAETCPMNFQSRSEWRI